MVDETQKPQETTAGTEGNSNAGVQSEANGLVDRGMQTAERLEAAIKKREELLAREEALYSKQLLSGRAEAGTKALTKEQEVDAKVAETLKKFYRRY